MTSAKTPPAEALPLAEYLCFAVYSANLAFGRAYKPMLDQLGLTYTQYIAVVALAEEDDQTVGSLGAKLFLESNTLTPMLKKLEAMGYLERRRDAADERVVRVRLTRAGRKLRDKARELNSPLVAATGLSPQEFARVQKSIAALRDSLIASTGEPGEPGDADA